MGVGKMRKQLQLARLWLHESVRVFRDRLVALDEAQREEPEEEEPPVEEDEPDDYMRDYYDEDQDPVDGDGDEQVL